jgi:hypothetical protein
MLIWIRIQALIRIQDVDDHKLYNFTVEKYPFLIKNYNLFISRLPCERPRYKRSLQRSKVNIQNFKT